jgi:MarR family transcriptional regulator, 2-MHQ and catechol-resistance regulon repressor
MFSIPIWSEEKMKTRLPAQAKQLHQALTHLVQRYQFRDRNDICCYGISVSQCHTLEALGEHGTQTMHALAEHLHLAVSTVTRVVDQLVDKGLAERHTGQQDRRVCEVALTPGGKELLGTIQSELIAREQAVLERLPSASRAPVIWAIEALSAAVDEWRKILAQDGEQNCPRGS